VQRAAFAFCGVVGAFGVTLLLRCTGGICACDGVGEVAGGEDVVGVGLVAEVGAGVLWGVGVALLAGVGLGREAGVV